ncbi:hypothetical protein NDU88_005892 [Pleurodeles waltl]|uniref:Uncharacterized protein n=1 Tax=Pleurodeles waltl TaxID=8319 RepID=A0AAV7SMZ3_PLEWA|nr:hypothetical protein NDU88_005892 [Pleurodeles waltl]
MNPKALKERVAKLVLARSKKKKERRHRRESSSKSSRAHHRHGDSRRRHDSRRRSSRGRSRSRSASPSARRRPTWDISPTVTPSPPTTPTSPGSVFEVEPLQRPEGSPEQELPGPSSASMPGPAQQQYPAFPAPGTDPAAFLNAMFNIFSTMAPGHAGPSGPLAFNLGVPASYKPTPFMSFLSSAAEAAPMPLTSPRRPATPTAPVDSPRIQSTVKDPVEPEGPASDGSEPRRRPTPYRRRVSSLDSGPDVWLCAFWRRKSTTDNTWKKVKSWSLQVIFKGCGIDTAPEWDLASPGEYTEEAASFHAVIRKAAEVLDLPLPAVEVKRNLLTEVLHPTSVAVEPLLPFNEALLDPIKDIWKKPVSSSAVNRAVARRYRVAPGDPVFLSKHPTPESLVVQASCSSRSSPGSFPGTPADRASKKMDHSAKKAFSSCSMALKSTTQPEFWDVIFMPLWRKQKAIRTCRRKGCNC